MKTTKTIQYYNDGSTKKSNTIIEDESAGETMARLHNYKSNNKLWAITIVIMTLIIVTGMIIWKIICTGGVC